MDEHNDGLLLLSKKKIAARFSEICCVEIQIRSERTGRMSLALLCTIFAKAMAPTMSQTD